MENALRLQILEYLNEKESFVYQIDIKTPFLTILNSDAEKVKFQNCVEWLENHKFINTNGGHYYLNQKSAGERHDLNTIVIKAQLTPEGEKYLLLKRTQTEKSFSNIYNFDGAINTIVGDNNTLSMNANDSFNNQKAINNVNPIMKWVLGTVSAIIAGLIVWYLTKG